MKWTHAMTIMLFLFACTAHGEVRIGTVLYSHSTVGTSAQDAIASGSVDRLTFGWDICHDGGSASAYLAVSTGVDPDTDGVRVATGECYVCPNCGGKALRNTNVKGSAAATGYSVVQRKQ